MERELELENWVFCKLSMPRGDPFDLLNGAPGFLNFHSPHFLEFCQRVTRFSFPTFRFRDSGKDVRFADSIRDSIRLLRLAGFAPTRRFGRLFHVNRGSFRKIFESFFRPKIGCKIDRQILS